MSDQERISPYSIDTISSIEVNHLHSSRYNNQIASQPIKLDSL